MDSTVYLLDWYYLSGNGMALECHSWGNCIAFAVSSSFLVWKKKAVVQHTKGLERAVALSLPDKANMLLLIYLKLTHSMSSIIQVVLRNRAIYCTNKGPSPNITVLYCQFVRKQTCDNFWLIWSHVWTGVYKNIYYALSCLIQHYFLREPLRTGGSASRIDAAESTLWGLI